MKRFFTLTILAGLFFYACNKETEKDTLGAHYADTLPVPKSYEALYDTLDSLNRLLFMKIRAGDVALQQKVAQKEKIPVEARTALWPMYTN